MWWQMRCIHFHTWFDSDEQQQTGALDQHCFPLQQMRKHNGHLCLPCCTNGATALGRQKCDHTCYMLCASVFHFSHSSFPAFLILIAKIDLLDLLDVFSLYYLYIFSSIVSKMSFMSSIMCNVPLKTKASLLASSLYSFLLKWHLKLMVGIVDIECVL